MTTISLRVYRDPKTGNEFVFLAKGHVIDESRDEPGWESYNVRGASRHWAMAMDVEIAPREWLDVVLTKDGSIEFPHVKGEIHSYRLQHGGAHAYFIAGPLFDECLADFLARVDRP